jgi:predicted ester cyclase
MRTKRQTVEAYWDASAKSDYATAGACVASGYTWIDHVRGVTATTMEQLLEAQAEDAAWSDRSFDIVSALETTDGALVVQATVSGTLNGEWCSVRGGGQHVSFDARVIFRFDDDARIVSEEHYSDALTVLKQVGA